MENKDDELEGIFDEAFNGEDDAIDAGKDADKTLTLQNVNVFPMERFTTFSEDIGMIIPILDKHQNPSKEKDLFEYSKTIGFLEINCTDAFPHLKEDEDSKERKYAVGLHLDMSFSFPRCIDVSDHCISVGSMEKCSDEMMSYLSNVNKQLDEWKADVRNAIDFFSNTMLGNGDLVESVEEYENEKNHAKEQK